MSIEYQIIGRHIREARNRKNLTQEAVASVIDMSTAYFGKVERGVKPINLLRLAQISELLETPLEKLVEGAVQLEGIEHLPYPVMDVDEMFLDEIVRIASGCSKDALELMLRLCGTVAEMDKQKA